MNRRWIAPGIALLVLMTGCATEPRSTAVPGSSLAPANAGTGGSRPPRADDPAERTHLPPDTVSDASLLPPAAPVPAGTVKEQATALADAIVGRGPGALAALRTGLRLSGIGVIDIDDSVVETPNTPQQGMNFYAGDLVATGRMIDRGYEVPLTDLLSVLGESASMPSMGSPESAAALLDDLRSNAALTGADDNTRTFFAELFAALGTQRSDAPYDVLGGATPDAVRLDAAQTELIVLRIAADVRVAELEKGGATPAVGAARTGAAPDARPVAFADPAKPVCSMGTTAKQVVDVFALTFKTVLKKFAGSANFTPKGPTDVVRGSKALVTIAKMIAVFALLDVKVELEGGAPLVRTKSTSPGEQRMLKTTVRFTTGKGQMLNCFRMMVILMTGVDLSLPNDGPVKDAEVQWIYLAGPVQFRIPSGQTTKGSGLNSSTDSSGVSKLGIEGTKQKTDLPSNIPKHTVKGSVMATVAAEKSAMFKDFLNAANALSSAMSGDPLGAAATLVTDFVKRLKLVDSTFKFDITDWVTGFKVDYTKNGFHVSGTKCDGPEGAWHLDVGGATATGGMSIGYSGGIDFTIDESLGGSFVLDIGVAASGLPPSVTAGLSASGSGDVEVRIEGDKATIEFLNVKMKGTAGGSAGGMSLNQVLDPGPSGGDALPMVAMDCP